MAVLVTAANAETTVRDVEAAARALGVQFRPSTSAPSARSMRLFATFARERPDALFVSGDPFFTSRRVQLANWTSRHAIPMTSGTREITDVGGLMSYGANIPDAWRQIGIYTGRILKGAKPADLPVVQATKLELVINAQTARILGLTLPTPLLATADEVIE